MNFDDIKRKNIRRQILRYIINVATSLDIIDKHMYQHTSRYTFTLLEKSLNKEYKYIEDDDKFIIVPKSMSNYRVDYKSTIYLKSCNNKLITSFSKMTHYR